MTSETSFCATTPIRTTINCRIIVTTTDTSIAHSKAYPNFTPAKVQTVTVPGPIKAAAMMGPGPMFLIHLFN